MIEAHKLNHADGHSVKVVRHLINFWFPPLILVVGTFGNVISFMAFARLGNLKSNLLKRSHNKERNNGRSRKGLTVYLYLCLLAQLDTGVLYFGLANQWLFTITGYSFKDSSLVCCKALTFFTFFFSHCSSFIIVAALAIRFLAIYSPQLASELSENINVKRISCIVLLVFALFNAHYLFNMQIHMEPINLSDDFFKQLLSVVRVLPEGLSAPISSDDARLTKSILSYLNISLEHAEGMATCEFKSNYITLWTIVDQLVYSVVPFFLMLGLIIMVKLNLSKSEMDVNFRTTPATVNNRNFTLQIHIENYKRFHIVGRKFTVLLSGVVVSFLVTTFPSVVLFLIKNPLMRHIDSLDTVNDINHYLELMVLAQEISLLLMYLNHSINFFIYYTTSPRFRVQLRQVYSFVSWPRLPNTRCKRKPELSSQYE